MSRAMTSSSDASAQNRPASVISITTRVDGEERDLAAEQSKAGIDVGGEDLQEAIDDARAPHVQCP